MKPLKNVLKTRVVGGALPVFAVTGAFLLIPADAAIGGSDRHSASHAYAVEGAWNVVVTLRDCSTGNALGSVNSLVTFARGGTLSEAPGSLAFAPGQRSPGHGVWTHLGGRTYSQRMIGMILFTTEPDPPNPGFEAGWQEITHTVELSDRDNFTSTGTTEFYDLAGELYRTGCATAAAKRFE